MDYEDMNSTPLDALTGGRMDPPALQSKRDMPRPETLNYDDVLKQAQAEYAPPPPAPPSQQPPRGYEPPAPVHPQNQQFELRYDALAGGPPGQQYEGYPGGQGGGQYPGGQGGGGYPQDYARGYPGGGGGYPQDYPRDLREIPAVAAPPAPSAAGAGWAAEWLGPHRAALALAAAAFAIIMYAMPRLHAMAPGALNTKLAWAATAATLIALASTFLNRFLG